MLCWIASYPRSGNTLFRTALARGWQIETASVYGRDSSGLKLDPSETLAAARSADGPAFVKTHRIEDATDPAPAVYIVRDGRDATVSLAHFRKAHSRTDAERGELDSLMLRASRQQAGAATWSQNAEAWLSRDAPTAIVRFEELREDPLAVARAALAELGIELGAPSGEMPSFEDMQLEMPSLVRGGRIGDWRREMPERVLKIFERDHGEMLSRLRYAPSVGERIHEGDAKSRRIVIFANCQGRALARLLVLALPRAEFSIEFIPNTDRVGTMLTEDRTLERIGGADHLIFQPLRPIHKALAAEGVAAAADKAGSVTSFPYIFNDGICAMSEAPLGGDDSLGVIHGEAPVRAMLEEQISLSDVLTAYAEGEIDFELRRRFNRGLKIMRANEKNRSVDIPLSEFIAEQHRAHKLMLTHNHPSTALLVELIRRLAEATDLPIDMRPLEALSDENAAQLPSVSAPLSPYDVEALGYEFAADEDWLEVGSALIRKIAAAPRRTEEPSASA